MLARKIFLCLLMLSLPVRAQIGSATPEELAYFFYKTLQMPGKGRQTALFMLREAQDVDKRHFWLAFYRLSEIANRHAITDLAQLIDLPAQTLEDRLRYGYRTKQLETCLHKIHQETLMEDRFLKVETRQMEISAEGRQAKVWVKTTFANSTWENPVILVRTPRGWRIRSMIFDDGEALFYQFCEEIAERV